MKFLKIQSEFKSSRPFLDLFNMTLDAGPASLPKYKGRPKLKMRSSQEDQKRRSGV
jgi:hypothetical protein